MSKSAGFVDEHRANNADRWDLLRVLLASREAVSFHVVGSEGDRSEWVVKARERLGDYGLDIRVLPGGHLDELEHRSDLRE